MKKHSFLWRTFFLFLSMTAIAAALITRLVDVQLLYHPEDEARSSTATRVYSVAAARGELLDRNGLPLVSNVLGFNIELDYYNWDSANQNEVILRLCGILEQDGAEHSDELPITLDPPYAYTFESWDSPAGRKLEALILGQKGWPERPDAGTLFGLLCDKYAIEKDMLLRDKRTVAGVRYFLDMVQFSAHNNMAVLARGIDIATVAKIAEQSLRLPGVTVQEANQRSYNTPYAAHVLGRVAAISSSEYETLRSADIPYKLTDTLGKDGMEKALEPYLRGIGGKIEVEVSRTTGEIVRETAVPGEQARPGAHCYLTLDLPLQQVTEDALAMGIERVRQNGESSRDGRGADIEGGAAVVLDIKTGEVLAMASYPTFDLSRYGADFAINTANTLAPLFNRAVSGAYPPGSTFKMASAVAALESGVATPAERIRDLGIFTYFAESQHQPACWIWNQRRTTHGNINVSQALAYSCNYYFYEVATRMGIDTLREYAWNLGLGQKTGIELSGESAGNLDGPQARVQSVNPWYPGDLLSVVIGQGANEFSPLQLASYMATILRGGTRLEAHLLARVVDYTGTQVLFEQQPVVLDETPLQSATIRAVKEGMKGVVTDDGTASSYFRNFPSAIGVGGKTGSAETRQGRSAHGVFVSFAPYDEPEIVVVVIGEYAGTGGSMAPICIEIYNHYFGLDIDVGLLTTSPEPEPQPQPTLPAATLPAQTEPQAPETSETTETTTEPQASEAATEPRATEAATEPESDAPPAQTQPETESTQPEN